MCLSRLIPTPPPPGSPFQCKKTLYSGKEADTTQFQQFLQCGSRREGQATPGLRTTAVELAVAVAIVPNPTDEPETGAERGKKTSSPGGSSEAIPFSFSFSISFPLSSSFSFFPQWDGCFDFRTRCKAPSPGPREIEVACPLRRPLSTGFFILGGVFEHGDTRGKERKGGSLR